MSRVEILTAETLPGLMGWLCNGDRGSSSNTIVQHITGLPANDGDIDHPWDPADVSRCQRLLEAVPAMRPYFSRMKSASPAWSRLYDRWDEIIALMDEDCPDWRTPKRGGSCPKAYALICELTKEP
jgi:hypothetical protein